MALSRYVQFESVNFGNAENESLDFLFGVFLEIQGLICMASGLGGVMA